MRNIIRLTEGQLNRIVLNTAKRLIREEEGGLREFVMDNYYSELQSCAEALSEFYRNGDVYDDNGIDGAIDVIIDYLRDDAVLDEQEQAIIDSHLNVSEIMDKFEHRDIDDSGNVWNDHGFADEEDYWHYRGL